MKSRASQPKSATSSGTNQPSSEMERKSTQQDVVDAYTRQAVVFLRQTLQEQREQSMKMAREVERLRNEAHRKEVSTLEMVAYLQKQMKTRERENAELSSKLSSFLQSEQEHLRNVEGACAARIAKHEEVHEAIREDTFVADIVGFRRNRTRRLPKLDASMRSWRRNWTG
jgi:vacuolar-type H+-ATPase subunit I/STV1